MCECPERGEPPQRCSPHPRLGHLLGEVGEDQRPLLRHQLVLLHPELLQQLPAGDREDGLQEAAPEDVGGLVAGKAVAALRHVAVAQPPRRGTRSRGRAGTSDPRAPASLLGCRDEGRRCPGGVTADVIWKQSPPWTPALLAWERGRPRASGVSPTQGREGRADPQAGWLRPPPALTWCS